MQGRCTMPRRKKAGCSVIVFPEAVKIGGRRKNIWIAHEFVGDLVTWAGTSSGETPDDAIGAFVSAAIEHGVAEETEFRFYQAGPPKIRRLRRGRGFVK
jgi:hypothetical protein